VIFKGLLICLDAGAKGKVMEKIHGILFLDKIKKKISAIWILN